MGITFVRPQQPGGSASESSTVLPATIPNQPPPLLETTLTASEHPTKTSHLEPVDSPKIDLIPRNDLGSHSKTQNESSSGEEEVVFVPRNQRRPNGAQSEPQKCKAQPTVPAEPPPIAALTPKNLKTSKKTPRGFRQSNDDDDEILADYIQNLEENGEDIGDVFSLRPLGNHLDDIDTGNERPHRQETRTPRQSDLDSDEPEIHVDINIAAVIGKRNGRFGPEYHFKPAGSTLEEALWLEGTDMTRDIQHLIDHFEAGLDDEDSDVQASDDQEDADQGLPKAPQFEEGDDEEDDDDEVDDNDEVDFDAENLVNMMLGKPNKQGKFPRASKLADAYDGFDIMNRERASLASPFNRKSRKANIGRPSNKLMTMNLDDNEARTQIELEQYIHADREKKRIRKQERDLRRQAGMLGAYMPTESGSMDIKGYPGGVTMSKVQASIKQFMMSGIAERLSLPPMQKQDRLQVHILAHSFSMQSKSQRKGNDRFPVLYKTKQSRLFEGDEKTIDILLSNPSGRGSWGKFGNNRGKAGRQFTGGGGGGDRTTHNKDGMIVGTGAAELSQGNKGYDMLAKMGWATGTGLGSNGTGILDPVQAIVKNSRAGLG